MLNEAISRDTADELLFEQITQMCLSRILSRLRSKHAAKTQRTRKNKKCRCSSWERCHHPDSSFQPALGAVLREWSRCITNSRFARI